MAALTIDKNEIEDFFSWRSLNFFLTKYEKFLRRMKEPEWEYETIMKDSEKTQKLTKEHILAVDNDDPFEEKDSLAKRRLGNMMLVDGSLNSCLGNKPIPIRFRLSRTRYL
ncbi:MAG: DUF1524 domain-containing protein [Ignavibacteriales bacterium]|nr:DUF1524 domain-containing protein [Ignavibacteriales bacterium]